MPVTAQIDVSVLLYRDLGVASHLIGSVRQRSQLGPLHGVEVLLARVWPLLHARLVVARKEPGYSCVELLQGEELAVPQTHVYPVVYDPHLVLHLGLLLGTDGLARYGDEAVVVAHIVHGLAEYRLIPVRPYYRSLKVVRDDYPGNPAVELQRFGQGIQEVLGLL